jgi:hypothetical protein
LRPHIVVWRRSSCAWRRVSITETADYFAVIVPLQVYPAAGLIDFTKVTPIINLPLTPNRLKFRIWEINCRIPEMHQRNATIKATPWGIFKKIFLLYFLLYICAFQQTTKQWLL